MVEGERTWIARLTPPQGVDVTALLGLRLGLDVWERHPGSPVVAAPESTLGELERRRLARVERRLTREAYEARVRDRTRRRSPGWLRR